MSSSPATTPAPRTRWRRLVLFYPVLLAIWTPLLIASRSPGQYAMLDLLSILATIALLTAVVVAIGVAIGHLVAGERGEHVAALAVAALVAWMFPILAGVYYPVRSIVREHVSWKLSQDVVLGPVLIVALLALGVWALRRRSGAETLNRLLAVGSVLLVAFQVIPLVQARLRVQRALERSPLVRALAAPIAVDTAAARGPTRDIYFIILDGHPNSTVYQERYGVDIRAFDDSLRALGFVVPRHMRSNYPHTILSLPSILNFAHVTPLASELDVRVHDYTYPRHLIRENRFVRFLKARGYRFILLRPPLWDASTHSRHADEEFEPFPGLDPSAVILRTELRQVVARTTRLRSLADHARVSALHPLRSFERLARVADDPAPTVTFAHFFMPHDPYVLDAACRPLERPVRLGDGTPQAERARLMMGQLQCADRLTLRTMREILRRSAVPPVILVMGDHGTMTVENLDYQDVDKWTPAMARERLGAFGAFYLPGGGDTLFTEPVTGVNVLRHVLVHYFGARIPRQPDSLYISAYRRLLNFRAPSAATLDTTRVPRYAPEPPRDAPEP